MPKTILLDCTFRDGGYYNNWDFTPDVVQDYLKAMLAAGIDVVEMGFRFIKNNGFKGPCAYTSDDFLRSLDIPDGLTVAVMVNGGDVLGDRGLEGSLAHLFPETAEQSPVDMVRFACHFHEFKKVLPAVDWLTTKGYRVGFNLMQIADRSREEVLELANEASKWPVEVLYFADSMGSMTPDDAARIIGWLREGWDGPIGIHTHDNMGLALQNTVRAYAEGATWLDATVTGMGRGPGNARTEELVIEAEGMRDKATNMVPLMALVRQHFQPMKNHYGWGTNPYYFLSGKYGIHPTYIQQMLVDTRYDEEDILSVIDHLRRAGGKSYSAVTLDSARTNFFSAASQGNWTPAEMLKGRDVLILGGGAGVTQHRTAVEAYIRKTTPVVIGLNTQGDIAPDLIHLRAACHPVRLMADLEAHRGLPQPLITPASMLPDGLQKQLTGADVLDFGIELDPAGFSFGQTSCTTPSLLVLAYVLAVAGSGGAARVLLAGFDGYPTGDGRNAEVEEVLKAFAACDGAPDVTSITPTRYKQLDRISVYGM